MASSRSKKTSRRLRVFIRWSVVLLVLALLVALLAAMFYGIGKFFDNNDAGASTTTQASVATTTTVTTTTTQPKPTVPTLNADSLENLLTSERIIVYNVTYETELFSRNADVLCDPASTTKLMTAILMSKYTQSGQIFTVGDELDMVESGSSVAGLKEGQQLTRDQMMDALMLPSGNDSAYVVAANVGRILLNDAFSDAEAAVEAFVAEMNRMAAELGCQSTSFENPDGMTAEGHKTTARDMLKIARMANTFTEIKTSVAKPAASVEISGTSYYWKNTNEMLRQGPYHFTYITGMKTGFTTPAGYCLVASANRIGEEVIVVVLGGQSSDERFADVYRLLEAAFAYHNNEN